MTVHYSIDFSAEVDLLISTKELPNVEERVRQVDAMIEHYYKVSGRLPHSYDLERLGSYLLADELRDKGTHKVKHAEFPFLSDSQVKLRNRRERRVGDDNLDFIKLKEVKNHPNAFKVNTQNKDV